jgi:FKBP-type peptidyl-prolyl cis-trans isomerase
MSRTGLPTASPSSSSSITPAGSSKRSPGAEATMSEQTQRILRVKVLMAEREKARIDRNFALSDQIRGKLNDLGVHISDQKGGVGPSGWSFKDGTTKKLPAGMTIPPEVIEALKSAPKQKNAAPLENSKKRKANNQDSQPPGTQSAKNSKSENKKTKTAQTSSESERMMSTLKKISSSSSGTVEGVSIEDIQIGEGKQAKYGDRLKINYVGRLKSNDRIFDRSDKKPFVFRLGRGEVIRGWDIGCNGLRVGGKRRLVIPPEKAYGRTGAPPVIPGNATLVFEVALVDIK